MTPTKTVPRILWLVIFCYAVIYTVWGSTYYFIKISVISIPALWVVGLRFLCGGCVMLGVCVALRQWTRLPTAKEWGTTVFLGLCLLVGGNMLVTIAEKFIDSYFAALVISCTPIAVAMYNRILFKIKLPAISGIGILFGVCGVGILLYNGLVHSSGLNGAVLMLVGALLLWSLATCMSNRLPHYPNVFIDSSLQMLFAGVLCCIIAPFVEKGEWVHSVQPLSAYGLAYLAVIGSLAFAAYNYLLLVEPPQRISSYALVNPLIATVLGVLFAHERGVPHLSMSVLCIVIGVCMLLYGKNILDIIKKRFST